MYGMIHKALRELAIEKAGEDAWREIATECKLDSEHFVTGLLEGLLERFGEKGEVVSRPRPDGAEFRIKRASALRAA